MTRLETIPETETETRPVSIAAAAGESRADAEDREDRIALELGVGESGIEAGVAENLQEFNGDADRNAEREARDRRLLVLQPLAQVCRGAVADHWPRPYLPFGRLDRRHPAA